jgi:hypothetical protein
MFAFSLFDHHTGENNGKFGKFPASYVQLMSAQSSLRMARRRQYLQKMETLSKSCEQEQARIVDLEAEVGVVVLVLVVCFRPLSNS